MFDPTGGSLLIATGSPSGRARDRRFTVTTWRERAFRRSAGAAERGTMRVMAWVKVPPEHHPLFLAALPKDHRVETRNMFGGIAASVHGHIFAGLFGRSTMVGLDDEGRAAALALEGAAPFDPMGDGRALQRQGDVAGGDDGRPARAPALDRPRVRGRGEATPQGSEETGSEETGGEETGGKETGGKETGGEEAGRENEASSEALGAVRLAPARGSSSSRAR